MYRSAAVPVIDDIREVIAVSQSQVWATRSLVTVSRTQLIQLKAEIAKSYKLVAQSRALAAAVSNPLPAPDKPNQL